VGIYSDSAYPVRSDLEAIHAKQINALGGPGTWGSGPQRLAIVQEARAARCEAGVQESATPPQVEESDLPEAARRVARQLAVRPQDFDRATYQQALDDGLTDASYTEIVGLVSRITDFDVLARGLGIDMVPLPAAEAGSPSRVRPKEAVQENAWVPTIPNGAAGGDLGKELYGEGHPQPYIIRSLSLVPSELRQHFELEEVQYLPLERFFDFGYAHHENFSRSQVEVIAGRVSAINECFY
jgi:hypothetical protein